MIGRSSIRALLFGFFVALFALVAFDAAYAATLRLSPDTGVYTTGGTFSVRVILNTAGEPVNASEGKLSFNSRQLSVVRVSRAGSIFNLWTQEPTYSNNSGTISFGGGSPSGYSGSAGTVMSVTFRALGSGTSNVEFTEGSVLAADGQGTNVLTGMNGGSYTISAKTETPEPEYIAPPNTPSAPTIESSTHPDPNGWYQSKTAEVSWSLPSTVTSVRTLLDRSPSTIPTKVYDDPIRDLTIEDLSEGVSYLHVQFRNADGWGRVAHYRLAVDSEKPSAFTITQSEDRDPASPEQTLIFDVTDKTSPVRRFNVAIDGNEPVEFIDESGSSTYTTKPLEPGNHNVVVEAFDAAGNSTVATYSFSIVAFDKPVFTEYPSRLNNEVIPVIMGETRPNAKVTVSVSKVGGETTDHQVVSGSDGVFTFIPDAPFSVGVYDLVAVAEDEHGAKSEPSEKIRMVVEVPGFIKIGSFVVSVLSVVVPTVALLVLLIFGLWYLWHRFAVWRRRVNKEAVEAREALAREFDEVTEHLEKNVAKLKKSRKGKLTKAETALIDDISEDIENARTKVRKEIKDIEDVVE